MLPNPLFVALCLALPGVAVASGHSSQTAAAVVAADLDRVTVSATRTPRPIVDVPNTVDVIERERMDDILANNLKDLFRYEPGISVPSEFGRFGIGGIRIRGLDGNRVRIQTDGIPVADAFAIGSFSNANRNFVDLDTLKRVEVVRGPTSSLYGSDALGGVVSFITRDPLDYLPDDKTAYFGFRIGHEGSWNALSGGATAAFGGERWSGMVALGHRQGRETENQGRDRSEGSLRTAPNPQHRDGRSLLSKLMFAPSTTQRFRLTVEGNEDDARTDVLTSRGLQSLTGAYNQEVIGDDHQSRARVSLSHEMDALVAGFADSLDWQFYRQDSQTTQGSAERRRTAAGVNELRAREFDFDQRLYGLQANARKSFTTGRVEHALSYGLDLAHTETRQKRDGRVHNLDTGAVSNAMLPDVFPVRDFPISRTTNAALYVQDEIAFAGGAFRLVPALRVDHYELRPRMDPIFAEDNPGVAVSDLTETNISPKLGAVWHFAQDWSVFGGYSRGFRSPPYNDVNIGFTNLMFGYTAIANPDLKPETSDGIELGLRFAGNAVHASLSGYYNRYDDFIESYRFIGFNDAGLMVYQSQNVADARIRGVELKTGVELGALDERLRGWSLRGAAAYARGDNRSEGMPLDSIDPLTATLGLAWDRHDRGVELAGRFVGSKDRLSDPSLYGQGGYGVIDLLAHWSFAPGAKLNLGVFNLTDRTYWQSGDVPAVAAASRTLDRYTSPGRNLSASVAFQW